MILRRDKHLAPMATNQNPMSSFVATWCLNSDSASRYKNGSEI